MIFEGNASRKKRFNCKDEVNDQIDLTSINEEWKYRKNWKWNYTKMQMDEKSKK